MIINVKNLLVLPFLLIGFFGFAQEEPENSDEFHHHSIAVIINHTTIFQGLIDGEKKAVFVPSWALDYSYSFNEKWALGLHNDIIIENFLIKKYSDGETLERNTPIASVIVGSYKLTKQFGIELGAGMEFDEDENFALARIGAEYAIEIPKHNLEMLFAIDYDLIFDAYSSINIGFGIAKLF
ncbi:hypothetical protein [Formosa maritima]|uniref:Porin family protein n=1 Tax=Formosa maritima TaxID=2592046 RepID=A0A5D0G0D7_9FLAO|nr:hypothetical protein [Formosa maritima]TYA52406.1 hypothetical protein FVF61_13795 [Formosa maritima]